MKHVYKIGTDDELIYQWEYMLSRGFSNKWLLRVSLQRRGGSVVSFTIDLSAETLTYSLKTY